MLSALFGSHSIMRLYLAFFVTLVLKLLLGRLMIPLLGKLGNQPIRIGGPESHLITKIYIPTMGGLIFILTASVNILLWCDLTDHNILILLITLLGYGILGLADDYYKLKYKSSAGIAGRIRFFLQSLFAIFIIVYLRLHDNNPLFYSILIPFIGSVDLGWVYLLLALIVIVGSSNAFNLTDGLDGLAILQFTIIMMFFMTIIYNRSTSLLFYDDQQLMLISVIVIACSLGFLWFNAFPAQIIMGDVGSLALGAFLGVFSIITKSEISLFIGGGILVAETLSVILQVFSYKTRKKRIFLMAPLHHHFEKMGWNENKIVMRFSIITFVLVIIATMLG